MRTKTKSLLTIFIVSFLFQSCYRNNIGFGPLPANVYTTVVFTDTVEPQLSTVVQDSFSTANTTSFLLGKYKDPYLGIVSTKPFFQMTVPKDTTTIIPASAKYDSIDFIIPLNKYYYGDTSRPQTIYVNELADVISYSYNNSLYNTTNFPVEPVPLGMRTLLIRPSIDDSIMIRLNDALGMELYNKIMQGSDDVFKDDNFQNYFKGISLSVNDNDTTAVYGLKGAAGNMTMRVYYHETTPYLLNKTVDFTSKSNSYSFNQIITDRAGTPLYSATPPNNSGVVEFPASQTNNVAFTQYGAGVLLKMTFPTLKGILSTDKIVRLQKAELVVRPIGHSYDNFKLKLPPTLTLIQTDATNAVEGIVTSASPVVDQIYGLNTYYQYDVTSNINTLLTTTGDEDRGFFLVENSAPSDPRQVDRAVMGNGEQPLYRTELLLTVIVINAQ